MSEERGGFSAGFVLGAIAGAAIAYALTHEDLRDALVGKAREAGNFAMDATGDLRSNAADLYARGKTVVDAAQGDTQSQSSNS